MRGEGGVGKREEKGTGKGSRDRDETRDASEKREGMHA